MLRKIDDLEELNTLAKEISDISKDGDIIFLLGDLGTGKTQFTKFFCKKMGLDAKSPSFGIVNDYGRVTHMDLYRLESYEEAVNIGILEILDDDSIKIIEWPEILGDEEYDLKMVFSYDGSNRTVELSGRMLERL